MQVESIALEPAQDIFYYLPPGGITMICPLNPINLHYPQHAASLQSRINVWAHGQVSHSVDGSRSKTIGYGMGVG